MGVIHTLVQPLNLDVAELAEIFEIRVEFGILEVHGEVFDSQSVRLHLVNLAKGGLLPGQSPRC